MHSVVVEGGNGKVFKGIDTFEPGIGLRTIVIGRSITTSIAKCNHMRRVNGLMKALISETQLVMTEVGQPWQRGSLQDSRAKMAGEDLYRLTTN